MDDLLSRVTIDPLAIKYPSRGETASAGLVAETTVGGCLDNLDGRVTTLEEAPAGGAGPGNYDVAVTTALVAGDVGKVVGISAGVATLYFGPIGPHGVLVSIDGAGNGVVRRWGEATCQIGDGVSGANVLVSADAADARLIPSAAGASNVFGRVLEYAGGGAGQVFITALVTLGMQAAS